MRVDRMLPYTNLNVKLKSTGEEFSRKPFDQMPDEVFLYGLK